MAPHLGSTQTYRQFLPYEVVDKVGCLFKGFFIQTQDTNWPEQDAFNKRRDLVFALPAADCNGTITFKGTGGMVASPYIQAIAGRVEVTVFGWAAKMGTVPSDFTILSHVAIEYPPSASVDFGSPSSSGFVHQGTVDVQKGEVFEIVVATGVFMTVTGGRAGIDPWGAMAIYTPADATGPGFQWQFNPS